MADGEAATVELFVDGEPRRAAAGITLAAALLNAGVWTFRHAVRGGARAPLCGMGICYECRVTVDGVPHRRACLIPVVDGMAVRTTDPESR
jgi:aerobic-type carbon monoxide dehydrogenase small subunit (CoxS/CutS family)